MAYHLLIVPDDGPARVLTAENDRDFQEQVRKGLLDIGGTGQVFAFAGERISISLDVPTIVMKLEGKDVVLRPTVSEAAPDDGQFELPGPVAAPAPEPEPEPEPEPASAPVETEPAEPLPPPPPPETQADEPPKTDAPGEDNIAPG